MARVHSQEERDRYYARRMDLAETPMQKFEVLRSRFMADVKRLPEELRNGAIANGMEALQGAVDSMADVIEDQKIGTRT